MNTEAIITAVTVVAFIVNITVQLTKELIPIPTQLWTIIVSEFVTIASAFVISSLGLFKINALGIIASFGFSFIIAYIAMYGFDMFRDLWQRFKNGENINKE